MKKRQFLLTFFTVTLLSLLLVTGVSAQEPEAEIPPIMGFHMCFAAEGTLYTLIAPRVIDSMPITRTYSHEVSGDYGDLGYGCGTYLYPFEETLFELIIIPPNGGYLHFGETGFPGETRSRDLGYIE